MLQSLVTLKERVERLRREHLKALGAYSAYEQLLEFRAPNLLGAGEAALNAKALGEYRGFINIAESALNTELHLSVAKLYDSHKDALHIDKLIRYAEQNQSSLTQPQRIELSDSDADEVAEVYAGLDKMDLLAIRDDLVNAREKIVRLKRIRDRQVAHLSLKVVENAPSLTYEEFAELIELSARILNLVSVRYYGNQIWNELYKDQVVNDSQGLLRLIRDQYRQRTERADCA